MSINTTLIKFIRDEIGDDIIPVEDHTTLESDLGISGIDADKFILSFSKKFNIDLSDFNIDNYFEPEVNLFIFKKKNRTALTVSDLQNAIHEGKLR